MMLKLFPFKMVKITFSLALGAKKDVEKDLILLVFIVFKLFISSY